MVWRTSILILFLCGTIAAVFLPANEAQQWPVVYSIVGIEFPPPMQSSEGESHPRAAIETTHTRRNLQPLVIEPAGPPAAPPLRRVALCSYHAIIPLPPEDPESHPRAPPSVD
ncbi:MAG: hypothetical protein IH600_18430 [Bacteroidetes bacterium]|nr:hypothetical protein [Bacteroidota bacterium]